MRLFFLMFVSFALAGCASNVVYNPMQASTQSELLLNQSGFKALQNGMTQAQVHEAMGSELLIGYQFESPNYKPMSVPNPYKTEEIKGTGYVIEYYIESIRQPDGIVSDDELRPLVFKNGALIGTGWPLANSVRPATR